MRSVLFYGKTLSEALGAVTGAEAKLPAARTIANSELVELERPTGAGYHLGRSVAQKWIDGGQVR